MTKCKSCTGTTETKCIRCDTPKSEWKGRWEEPLCKVGRQTFDSHTGTTETTLEERLGNILFESIGIKSKGIVDRTLEQNLFVDNENILDFIKQELQQERERIVKEINNIPTHFDEGQGAVGRYSYKIIKAINQDHE